ncbi:translocation/assembly module TamB domain-containing protein [Taibaiella koreensis]|uniref:translocation/assembly module TamB domain-containing protein n=1 Tax=Taibaiella koreensis TaxID=1268548 RepID=UPI0013C34685|nr:translocation/assembly module TamB domain-containing protein [Taibaiella koreensis]
MLGIIIILVILVNFTPVQNFVAQKAVGYLSDKLGTKVTLKHVRLNLFNSATLEGLYIQDKQGDTLLYAGEAEVKITDWFFLKDKPVISYVGLRQAYANLHRGRSSDEWNYQFVIDAFASKSSKPKKKKEGKLNLDLREVVLEQLRFHMVDEWSGSDMIGELESFTIHARQIDFEKKIIDVRSIEGNKVLFGIRDYKGGRPARPKSNAVPEIDTIPFNPDMWKVSLGQIKLSGSRFFLEDPDTKAERGYFDATHMDVKGLELDARDIVIRGDTLTGDLALLKGRDRSGIEIKKMAAKVTVSPNLSECRDLDLQTGYSHLRHYYAMRYKRFPDFEDYLTNVVMVADLEQSEVGIQDIAYFAPAMSRYSNLSVAVSGKGNGTVEKLRVKDLVLNDGFTRLKGDLYMNGLPDIESTFIDFQRGEVHTNGAAAFVYVPELRGQQAIDLSALSTLNFTGSFTGFINDFVAYGTLSSNLGNAKADINLKFPRNAQPVYSGNLTTEDFDLGRLLRADVIGKVSVDAAVKGKGFDAATAAIDIEGTIKAADLNGYHYQNITVDGTLAAKKFDGKLTAKDPNLDMDFDGKIDFSGERPLFQVDANIGHVNATALKLTKDSITAEGKMRLDFSGSNIDNFVGSASIYHINILRDSTRLNIDSLQLTSHQAEDGTKVLTLNTNDVNATVSGRFSLLDLPGSAKMFLSYYLPQYVTRPEKVNEHQDIRFDITAGNTDDLLSLFSPAIRVGSGLHLNGSMNMANQELLFKGIIPYFTYGSFRFSNIQIDSRGSYSGFGLQATANGIKAGEMDIASTVQLQTNIFQDSARFQVLTTTPTSIGSAKLNGMAYADRDSFFLHIQPSEFYLNQSRWEIPDGNQIVLAKDYLSLTNLRIQSGLQKILINTDGRGQPGDADIRIENFDIAPLHTLLGIEDINLDGRINGQAKVTSLLKDQKIDFDVTASDLRINSDTLGEAKAIGSYDVAKSLITLSRESGLSYKDSRASLTGTYSFDPQSKENIDGEINLEKASLSWAQPFLSGYVHSLTGHVSGAISVKGSASDPVTTGSIELDQVGFVPDITGAHYTIREATIGVSDTKFDFGSITVTDDDGREGVLSGNIQHSRLSKMNFRLNLRSDNIKVVDLKDYQNPNFYGDVKASVQLRLSGPANNLNLNIFATPQKNSHLFIPIGYGSDVSDYEYIRFKQYGEVQTVKEVSKNKLNIRIDAIATPDLEATIILDPNTGDQIWAKGSGNLILEIPSSGEMKMNGNYIIDEGKYNFSFKQLQVLNYKRQFTINSNSVIKWNGDIADADLDVTAYAQIKARLYDLIINEVDRVGLSQSEIRDAQIMQMVNVQMNMRGSLKEPEFGFKLDLAENRSVGTYAYQKLQRVNSDDKELLNQVASLLLLEQFVPPEGISNSNAVASGTINNLSELISSTASSQITNFANKILGMEDLYIGLRYKNYNLADNSQPLNGISYLNRNEAGVNLRKNFFNNRLIVEVGGVYDWGRNNAQSDFTTNFAGDFRVQYLLSEDGRIRFNVFRTSNYDALFSQLIGRQGVGLSYRKSFNGLLDLFKSEEKMRKEREERLKQQRQQTLRRDNSGVDTSSQSLTQSIRR